MPFTFSPESGRYRDAASGRFIRDQAVRSALDTVINAQAATMRANTQALIDGRLSLADWQLQQMQAIKSVHLVGLATANGGWNNLDQSDFGWAGQRIRREYAYLRDFTAQIASGKQPLNGTALARSELYAHAGRQTHRAAIERAAKDRGMAQERNQLGAADHCAGCLAQTSRGWVPIGSLVPCGSRDCLSRCHCSLSYRMMPAA